MSSFKTDHPAPTRRALLKGGTAAVASLGLAPHVAANTGPHLMQHDGPDIVVQFDVAPGQAQGLRISELKHR